ncbi:MAG: TIGR01244 family phosphatase [Alphaproteobacteria bacterium]|nr:TIGR01244 family phosphatase [Alphaproteobacteria bacterium]
MKIETVSHKYAVSGQIVPEDVRVIAQAGYKTIVCMRPDGEAADQPRFDDIARAASGFEVKAAYVPVSGSATRSQLMQFRDVCEHLPKPVLGYCNSGARATSIYRASR